MSMQYVTILYGPSNTYHTLSHKSLKLTGLRDRLRKLGYRVDLVPVSGINQCRLEMCGYEVFRCNINSLMFNCPYEVDVVCQRAVQAVVEATTKLLRARNRLYFWTLLQRQVLKGVKFGIKDHYILEIEDVKDSPTSIDECVKCCAIRNRPEPTQKDIK